jgi:hypothetical protein
MDEHRESIQTEKPIPMSDHREGIQANKPIVPWERPGCFLRDVEPHRGEILKVMAILGLIVSQMSMCLPVLLLIGMPLNVITWYLAKLDLAKMSKGRMEPSGEKVTTDAKRTAGFAFVIGIICAVTWAMVLLVLG